MYVCMHTQVLFRWRSWKPDLHSHACIQRSVQLDSTRMTPHGQPLEDMKREILLLGVQSFCFSGCGRQSKSPLSDGLRPCNFHLQVHA